MAAGGMRGVAQPHALHGFLRILVLRRHEPPWFVGADWQDGQPKAAMSFRHPAVVCPAVETGVAGEIDLARRRLDDEARP